MTPPQTSEQIDPQVNQIIEQLSKDPSRVDGLVQMVTNENISIAQRSQTLELICNLTGILVLHPNGSQDQITDGGMYRYHPHDSYQSTEKEKLAAKLFNSLATIGLGGLPSKAEDELTVRQMLSKSANTIINIFMDGNSKVHEQWKAFLGYYSKFAENANFDDPNSLLKKLRAVAGLQPSNRLRRKAIDYQQAYLPLSGGIRLPISDLEFESPSVAPRR
jgi:hypothetical protein